MWEKCWFLLRDSKRKLVPGRRRRAAALDVDGGMLPSAAAQAMTSTLTGGGSR